MSSAKMTRLIAFQRRKSLLVSRSVMMFVADARSSRAKSCALAVDSARPKNISNAIIPAKRSIQPGKPYSPKQGVQNSVALTILSPSLSIGRYITAPIHESFIKCQWLLTTSFRQEVVDKSHMDPVIAIHHLGSRLALETHPVSKLVWEAVVIRKLKSGKYRLYSRKKDPKTGKRRNLGTFDTREAAEKHERAVQYFKRRGA